MWLNKYTTKKWHTHKYAFIKHIIILYVQRMCIYIGVLVRSDRKS